MPTPNCPSDAQLKSLLAGEAPDADARSWLEHLARCPACESRAAEVGDLDTLVDDIRAGSTLTEPDPETIQTLQTSIVERADTCVDTCDGVAQPPWASLAFELGDDAEVLKLLEPPEQPGDVRRLGKYRILRVLGRGGMGVVFDAEDSDLRRRVAIKIVRGVKRSPAMVERFLREAQASARLRHPNLVTIYNVDQTGGAPYISMELLDGPDLEAAVKEEGPLSPQDAARAIRGAALGLAHAHERGVVHRDVKPSNLMRDGDSVKVLDLGVARIAEEAASEKSLTGEKSVVGTPDYMAPEQLVDAHRVDARADVYSLGGSLHYLLTGRPPAQSVDLLNRVLQRHAEGNVVPPECPAPLAPALSKMLALRPDDRFQSMSEVVDAMDAFLASPRRTWSRLEVASVASIVLLLVVAAFAGIMRIKTPGGTIVLELADDLNPPAEVFVDGNRLTIRTPEGKPIEIAVDEKEHQLEVRREGFRTFTKAFTVASGSRVILDVKLESLPDSPTSNVVPAAAAKSESTPPANVPAREPLVAKLGTWKPDLSAVPLYGIAPYPASFPGVGRWQLITTSPRGPVNDVAWSPDGRWIACSSDAEAIRVYDAKEMKLKAFFTGAPNFAATMLAWSADSQRLACATVNGRVRILTHDLKPLAQWSLHGGNAASLAWAPDSRTLMSASDHPQGEVAFWNEDGTHIRTLRAADDKLLGAAFHPQGTSLATGSVSGRIRVWDREGTLLREFHSNVSQIRVSAWSPDGEWITTSRIVNLRGDVRLWKPDGTPGATINAMAKGLCWRPDSQLLALFGAFELTYWKPTGEKVSSFGDFWRDGFGGLGPSAFAPDGREILLSKPGLLTVRDLKNFVLRVARGLDFNNEQSLRISPDGRWIALVAPGGRASVWSDSGRPQGATPPARIATLAWSQDSQSLAYLDNSDTVPTQTIPESFADMRPVRSWFIDGREGPEWKLAGVYSRVLSFTPEGGLLAGEGNGQLLMWSNDGERQLEFPRHNFAARSIAWSPAADQLATGDAAGYVRWWSREATLRSVQRHDEEPGEWMMPIAWSHDGRMLVSARKNTIRLWNANGEPERTLAVCPTTDISIQTVSWLPGDQSIVSVSKHGRTAVIRVANGAVEREWRRTGTYSYTVSSAVHPDGQRVGTVDWLGAIFMHDNLDGRVLWVGVNLPNGPVTVSPAGEILEDTLDQSETELAYVVERPDGGFDVSTPTEFRRRVAP